MTPLACFNNDFQQFVEKLICAQVAREGLGAITIVDMAHARRVAHLIMTKSHTEPGFKSVEDVAIRLKEIDLCDR